MSKWYPFWFVAFVASAFALYWPTLHWTPFSDDHSALWKAGVHGIPWRNGFFRPLSDLTFRVGFLLWGTAVEGHRAYNVVIHGTNAFLLFLFLVRWMGPRTAILSASLFLLYPFHQESIVWLVGRESALGTTSTLLGLMIIGSGPWNLGRAMLVLTTLFLGGLCYESALLLAPMALLIAWSGTIPGWPPWRRLLMSLLLPTAILLVLRWSSTGAIVGGYFQELLPANTTHALQALPKALGRLVLLPEPDHRVQLNRGAVLLLVLVVVHVFLRRSLGSLLKRQLTLLGSLVFIACMVAFVAGVSTMTSESDRFLYLPSAFLCAVVGVLLAAIPRPAFRWPLCALILVASYGQLRQNHAHWEEASRITERCVEHLPPIPTNGALWVQGLPDSYRGAYIFRNGFPEAVDLAGGAGERIVVVPTDALAAAVRAEGLDVRGERRTWRGTDRWYHWNGARYIEVHLP